MTHQKTAESDGHTKGHQMANGSSTASIYQVQVRVRDNQPGFALGDMIIDQLWKNIRIAPSQWPVGVPTPRYAMENLDYGVPFQVAEAQRWLFICMVEANQGFSSTIETRIIERRMERTWKCEEVGQVTKFPSYQDDHNIWVKSSAAAR